MGGFLSEDKILRADCTAKSWTSVWGLRASCTNCSKSASSKFLSKASSSVKYNVDYYQKTIAIWSETASTHHQIPQWEHFFVFAAFHPFCFFLIRLWPQFDVYAFPRISMPERVNKREIRTALNWWIKHVRWTKEFKKFLILSNTDNNLLRKLITSTMSVKKPLGKIFQQIRWKLKF